MTPLSRRDLLATLGLVLPPPRFAAAEPQDGWVPLFDGGSLSGWKANQPASWSVAGGAIVADGGRSHLFYTGAEFKNFEFSAEVMTRPHANSGIFFHTVFQPDGWPAEGFQVEVNNTALVEGRGPEPQKTGSLFGVRNVYKQFADDGDWFTLLLTVRDKSVQVRLNDLLLVDYLEPSPPLRAAGQSKGRVLGRGTFALQCHDPGSKAQFRNLRVRRLPDTIASPTVKAPLADGVSQQILDLMARTVPVVDYRVRLEGRPLDEVLDDSRHTGIECGIVARSDELADDREARRFLASTKDQPCFVGLEATGMDWRTKFSADVLRAFDYVVGANGGEGIDLVADASSDSEIDAAVRRGTALEIGSHTTADFVQRAKAAGARFTLGGGGRLERSMSIAAGCKLEWRDFFIPERK